MGRGYAVECCMAAFRRKQEERLYRAYVTDALKYIAENSARYAVPGVGMVEHGTTLAKRWIDLTDAPAPEPKKPEDTRPAAEVAADIWTRIRGDAS